MKKPAGLVIDVPVTLSVSVRGTVDEEKAFEIAQAFAERLDQATDFYVSAFMQEAHNSGLIPKVIEITEVSLEASREDSCEVLDELEAESDEDEDK